MTDELIPWLERFGSFAVLVWIVVVYIPKERQAHRDQMDRLVIKFEHALLEYEKVTRESVLAIQQMSIAACELRKEIRGVIYSNGNDRRHGEQKENS